MSASVSERRQPLGDRIVYLSQGTFKGRPVWHYMLIKKLKLPLLLRDAKEKDVNLTDYGNILFSGFGKQPPEEVSRFIKMKYDSSGQF